MIKTLMENGVINPDYCPLDSCAFHYPIRMYPSPVRHRLTQRPQARCTSPSGSPAKFRGICTGAPVMSKMVVVDKSTKPQVAASRLVGFLGFVFETCAKFETNQVKILGV